MNIEEKDGYECNFCGAFIKDENVKTTSEAAKWSLGVRGKIYPIVPYSGYNQEIVKCSCPEQLCQAKLLVWTRS